MFVYVYVYYTEEDLITTYIKISRTFEATPPGTWDHIVGTARFLLAAFDRILKATFRMYLATYVFCTFFGSKFA